MGKIEQTLKKIRGDVAVLLIEIFPEMNKEIQFAYEDNFQEWFGMLFELNKWNVHPSMVDISVESLKTSTTKIVETRKELRNYEGLEDYGFISTVLIKDDIHLIDGYHRVLKARGIGITRLRGCIWTKAINVHPNCVKIKQLIINNL